jgi:molybdate transport system substrate-binding protein
MAASLTAVLAGCGAGPQGDEPTTLTVYAASSLKSAFEQVAREFEAQHEGVDVELNFAGSSDLVAQIQQGAPADVFASADAATMDALVADDLTAAEPVAFASNTLQLAVPPGNPAGVETLADAAVPGVDLVLCAPQVPCGAAAARIEAAAGLDLRPVSEEQNVTDVLNKVVTGEADVGLVYVTDVLAAGDAVEGIELAESGSAVNTYLIAPVEGGDDPALANEFVELVVGSPGQSTLAALGFGRP